MMFAVFYNVNLVVGLVLGVVLFVWMGIIDSELTRQEQEQSISQEWNNDERANPDVNSRSHSNRETDARRDTRDRDDR